MPEKIFGWVIRKMLKNFRRNFPPGGILSTRVEGRKRKRKVLIRFEIRKLDRKFQISLENGDPFHLDVNPVKSNSPHSVFVPCSVILLRLRRCCLPCVALSSLSSVSVPSRLSRPSLNSLNVTRLFRFGSIRLATNLLVRSLSSSVVHSSSSAALSNVPIDCVSKLLNML